MSGASPAQPCEIDPATGLVTLFGASEPFGVGNAMAADAAGTLYLVRGNASNMFTVDTTSGLLNFGPIVSGGIHQFVNSMGYLDGTLFAVDTTFSFGVGGSPSDLMTLDPTTGVLTAVGPLPTDVDAVAGNFK
jgi:hypothetical protein